MPLDIVIMAAGKGTRMKSARPKVLHHIGGKPMLAHVLATCATLEARSIVVITGHGADAVEAAMRERFPQLPLRFVRQEPQLGTGHAVQQAAPVLPDDGSTLILNGDVPLIRAETARSLAAASNGEQLALLAIELPDATGYGRLVREGGNGNVQAIVEHKDATPAQREIREVYTGMMAAPTKALKRWLAGLKNDNAQKEYYLTDVVAAARADGVAVVAAHAANETEVLGINSPAQLADLERRLQKAQATALLEAGVRLADPARFDLRGELLCGNDVDIDVNCVFEGKVELGDGVAIGPNCVIRNARIAPLTQVQAYTHIEGESPERPVIVGRDARIGPFARLRPGADLGNEVHIGNFVEVKNSTLADGAKANHLAYLGDATVGERVNYGAGSITANYDGANKHRTTIGADVHVGSNSVLVAPVTIGEGATVGGGSTITKDVAPGALAVARGKQIAIEGWARPKKKAR